MDTVKQATGDFQKYVVDIERHLTTELSPSIEDIRKIHGDRISNEILASVCALLCARSVAMIHVWTGEPVELVAKRLNDAMMANIKPTMAKIIAKLSAKEMAQ